MSKIIGFVKSPHIQIALATGFCIVIMAYFSKRVLPQPIGYLPAAIPPFLMAVFESLLARNKNHRILNVRYWIMAVFLSTAIIITVYFF